MGSELAETDIYSFMQFCKDNLIPIIDTSATELEEELTNYKSLIK
jgi:septin family protein